MPLIQPFKPQPGEEVIMTCRHDLWKLLPMVVVFVALAAASALAWFLASLGGLALGIAAAAVLILNWGYLHWYSDILVITDKRIAVHQGVIGGSTQQAPLHKIQSVTVSTDLASRLVGVGMLRLDTGALGGALVYPRLPDADEVGNRIQHLLAEYVSESEEAGLEEIKSQLRSQLHL